MPSSQPVAKKPALTDQDELPVKISHLPPTVSPPLADGLVIEAATTAQWTLHGLGNEFPLKGQPGYNQRKFLTFQPW